MDDDWDWKSEINKPKEERLKPQVEDVLKTHVEELREPEKIALVNIINYLNEFKSRKNILLSKLFLAAMNKNPDLNLYSFKTLVIHTLGFTKTTINKEDAFKIDWKKLKDISQYI